MSRQTRATTVPTQRTSEGFKVSGMRSSRERLHDLPLALAVWLRFRSALFGGGALTVCELDVRVGGSWRMVFDA